MIDLSVLVNSINDKLSGTGYRAIVGGSVVLKLHGLLERKLDDVDIIIAKSFMATYESSDDVVSAIKNLFPLNQFYSSATEYGDDEKTDRYFWNEKVDVTVATPVQVVNTINFMMHKEVGDEYFSRNTHHGLPITSLKTIIEAKKSYNRPKDIVDFHEIQKILFF
jgi:hypothetical protein